MLSPVSKFLSVQRKHRFQQNSNCPREILSSSLFVWRKLKLWSAELRAEIFYQLFSSISALISTLNVNILSFDRFFNSWDFDLWTNERSGQLKNNKMKADNFNPNQLPSWPATFCVCNIILAISSTILVSQRKFLVYNLLDFFLSNDSVKCLRFDEIISLFPYSRWPTPLFWIKPTKVALKNWLKEKTAQEPSIIYVKFYDFIAGKCSFKLNFINLKWSSNTTIVQNLYYKTFYYKNDQNSDSLTVIDSFYEYTFKFVDFLFYKTNQF